MNTTGRAKGPGPHRTHVRETQKRGVVRQARRASRSAAFGLRPGTGAAGFIGKRRAVSSGQAQRIPAKIRPVSLGPFVRACSYPSAPAAAGIACLGLRSLLVSAARSHGAAPRPSPSSAIRYGNGLGQMRKLAPAGGQGSPPSLGPLSARASQGLARPDSRRRPRRSPRPWQASAHKGRCRAA